jgi:hypothetical protein
VAVSINRAAFGTWGAGLDDTRFAAALAALGVARARPDRHPVDAVEAAWRGREMLWVPSLPGGEPLFPADVLAEAWLWGRSDSRDADSRRADPRGLEAELPRLSVAWRRADDPAWAVRQLSREDIGPLAVHVMRPAAGARIRWTWPLEIGLLDEPGSEPLARLLRDAEEFWPARFASPRDLAAGGSCDLLLMTGPTPAAAGRLLTGGVRASCVLLLRPATAAWEVTDPLLHALQAQAGAAGIGFAPVPPARTDDWLRALLVSLAHNHPIDVALRLAALVADAATPMLFADEALLEASRLSAVAERLAARAERRGGPVRAAGESAVPPMLFDSEMHGAAEVIRMGRVLRSAVEEPDPPRYLQARVLAEDGNPPPGPLQPGGDYVVGVRIAPPDDDTWISATGPEFPPLEGSGPHRLTVVVTAPDVLPEPGVDEIVLPPTGPSSMCEFPVHIGPGVERLRGRIVVLYGNRVLQTATLDVPVGDSDGPVRFVAEPEATVRLRLDDLDSRRPFDAALVVNHDDAGTPGVTAIAGDRAQVFLYADFKDAVERIREALEDAVVEPVGYDSLDSDETVELLVFLAYHGSTLCETFLTSDGAQSVVDSDRLQVVPLRPGADFPLEFVYDRVAPEEDARLCPSAADGLRTGACPAGCAGRDDPHVVCPLGFWGLTKSIERLPFTPRPGSHEVEVRAEPSGEASRLGVPDRALFATSAKVADLDVTALGKTLGAAMHGNAQRANSWTEWRQSVACDHPALLVLLPHTLTHETFRAPAMEISGDSPLARNNIGEDLVCPGRAHRPVVILLGCNTAAPEIAIDAFPPMFRSQGAAIVLATVTKVLGRHAAPVAGQIATELVARANEGETYITDIVRDVRRALLAQGRPMGLTLVAYGDGEWTFGGT